MWNWLFGLPEWILWEQSPWCQRKWWACSWLCSSTVSPFSVSGVWTLLCTVRAFFAKRLSNHCQGPHHTFSKICTKSDVPLSDPSWYRTRPNKQLQIKGHKNQHVHPAEWNFVHLLPR
jgi:hypothetical protein